MAESMKFCRICLKSFKEHESVFPLNEINALMLQSKLLDFMSEFDLRLTPEPIACYQCMTTIQVIHNFKQLCIKTEKTLKGQQLLLISKPVEVMIKEEVAEDVVKKECVEANGDVPVCPTIPVGDSNNNHKHNIQSQLQKKTILGCLILKNPRNFYRNRTKSIKLLKCNKCNFMSKYIQTITKHLMSHSRTCFKCYFCNFGSYNPNVTKAHALTHTKFQYKCENCVFSTNIELEFRTHMASHQEESLRYNRLYGKTYTRQKPFKCQLCSYSCTRKKFLDDHHEKEHLDKPVCT